MKYQNLIEMIFPGNTKRRRCYDIGFMAIRTIANEGWSAFFNKSLRFLQKKNNDNQNESSSYSCKLKPPLFRLSLWIKKYMVIFQSNIDQLTEIRIITATYQRKNTDISFILRLKF